MSESLSPSEELTTLTVDHLIAAGLIRAERRDAMIAKIAAGSITGSDWSLEVELATEGRERS